jgi:ubiquinone/menaquinone biosynthesis C-methylase UbiE
VAKGAALVFGIDVSPQMVEQAQKVAGDVAECDLQFVAADAASF